MNPHPGPRGRGHVSSRSAFALLTLDVFDTCLIRDFVSQESLWYLLGQEIAKQLPGITGPAEFMRIRGRADAEARGQGSAEDITLADVYARIPAAGGWTPEQQRQAIAIEEDFEGRGLRLNPPAQALLAKAHGATVAYLTDTTHRGAFIRECLDEHSLPAGTVLSSGDLGLRKGTGSLFREASRRFNVGCGQMLHIGNDMRSDAAGSARAGVPFALLDDANPTRYETTLDGATRKSIGLLGAVLAGRGRDFRLAKTDQPPQALVSVVSGVAGPAVFAAVAWTLLSAQRDGTDTLYFVARDGEILLAVAKLLQQELGLASEIECRYLYGSRRAWHLPALALVPAPEFAAALRRLLLQSGQDTLRGLLSQLDLGTDEALAVVERPVADISVDAPLGDRLAAVIEALAGSSAVQSLVRARAEAAHQATVSYLRQEQMFSGGRVGLVDIGWHGAASASLVTIAAAQGTSVRCYFAGGLCGRGSVVAPEDSRAFLIDARGEEPELRAALVHLMESFCAGSGGSTLGYAETDGRWHPCLAPDRTNRAVAWGLPVFQALVCEYAAEVCRGLLKFDWDVTLDELAAIRPFLVANLSALWNSPTYEEAEVWGSFPFEDDDGSPMLGRAVAPSDVAGYVRHFRNAERRPRFGPWSRAVVARTIGSPRLADPFATLRIISTPQQRLIVRARVRSRLAFRPVVRLADVDVRDGGITVNRRLPSIADVALQRGRHGVHFAAVPGDEVDYAATAVELRPVSEDGLDRPFPPGDLQQFRSGLLVEAPADVAGGNSAHDLVGRDILGHEGTRGDHGAVADRDPAHDERLPAHPHVAADRDRATAEGLLGFALSAFPGKEEGRHGVERMLAAGHERDRFIDRAITSYPHRRIAIGVEHAHWCIRGLIGDENGRARPGKDVIAFNPFHQSLPQSFAAGLVGPR
jgi:hypothetical protein